MTGASPCSVPLATSQSRVVPSRLDDARVAPSGANATASIASRCPSREWRTVPEARSQTFTVQSSEPVASVLPSGANATHVTALVCRARVARSAALATSQSVTEASRLPEASVLPSGANATHVIAPAWPSSVGPLSPGGEVPELDDLAVAAGGQGLAVGADRQGADRSGRVAKPAADLVGRHVPERHDRAAGGRRDRLAVGS